MLDTYFELGGVEIANGMRLRGLLRADGCGASVVKGTPCDTLGLIFGETYEDGRVEDAPWFDASLPESARFYGVEVIRVAGAGDTLRSVSSLEGIADGQIFTAARKQGQEMRFEVAIFAADRQALEYGRSWLSSVLDGSRCGGGLGSCGTMDLAWLAECPEPRFSTSPVETFTNVFTNPRFLKVGADYGRLEGFVSEILAPTASTEWGESGQSARISSTPATTLLTLLAALHVPDVAAGQVYTVTAKVLIPDGYDPAGDDAPWSHQGFPTTGTIPHRSVGIFAHGTTGGLLGSSVASIPSTPGVHTVKVSLTVPAGVAPGGLSVLFTEPGEADQYYLLDGVTAVASGSEYPYGIITGSSETIPATTIGGEAFTFSWDGAVDDSTSTMTRSLAIAYDVPATQSQMASLEREMLDTVTTSGPIEKEISRFDSVWMQQLEFTISSEHSGTYSSLQQVPSVATSTPDVVQEILLNLAENPRGRRISSPAVTKEYGRNIITNPSLETNLTGWTIETTVPGAALSRIANTGQLVGARGSWIGAVQIGGGSPAGPIVVNSPRVNLPAGTTHVVPQINARLQDGLSGLKVSLILYDVAGFPIDTLQMPLWNSTQTLYKWTGPGQGPHPVPAEAVSARITIQFSRTQSTALLTSLYFDEAAIFTGAFVQDLAEMPMLTTTSKVQQWPASPVGAALLVEDLSPAWSGTANASATILQATGAAGWSAGDSLGAGIASPLMTGSGSTTAIRPRGSGEDSQVYVGYKTNTSQVVAGRTYFASTGWTLNQSNAEGLNYSGTWAFRWFNASGTLISTAESAPEVVRDEGRWSGALFTGSAVAPAGAVNVEAVLTIRYSSNTARFAGNIGGIMISPFQINSFFDGDSINTATAEYTWNGAQWQSASTSTPVENGAVVDPLRDPDCPPDPAPPLPPSVEDPCASDVTEWHRYYVSVDGAEVPEVLSLIPELTFLSATALDAMRVTVVPNPAGGTPEAAMGNDAAAYWEVTYLPAGVALTLDSLASEARAVAGGEEMPADRLVIGMAGQPVSYPTFSCGQGYVIAVDVPLQSPAIAMPVTTIRGRRQYR